MVRFILWFLILWFIMKAIQTFIRSRRPHDKSGASQAKPFAQPPFKDVEDADFEDITPKR